MPELTYKPMVFDELTNKQQFVIPGAMGAMSGMWERQEIWQGGRYFNAVSLERFIPHRFDLTTDVLVPNHRQVSLFEGVL